MLPGFCPHVLLFYRMTEIAQCLVQSLFLFLVPRKDCKCPSSQYSPIVLAFNLFLPKLPRQRSIGCYLDVGPAPNGTSNGGMGGSRNHEHEPRKQYPPWIYLE